MSAARIEDYALLGDLWTAALVGRDGSIDWLCLPRFDSPAVFAALLDTEGPAGHVGVAASSAADHADDEARAGFWRLAPAAGGTCTSRAYRGDSLVLESVWETPEGTVAVLDFMPPRGEAPDVVRIVEGRTGRVPMRSALRLRFDYGRIVPWVRHVDGHLAAVAGPDAVRRSLVVLKALTYAPTGGIVAAATTSLPEELGGVRNWDYRFCWLRDATFTLQALLGTGFVEEARAWREWLLRAVAGDPADLQIMYGIDGTRRLPETELPWLSGYEGSRPVRIGNGASDQLQLDVWGEVLDGLHRGREAGLDHDEDAWLVQRALMDHLEGHWQEPDNGLWEVRGERRHFVHSKVLTWAGVDRMVTAVERFGREGPVDRWRRLRSQIHAEVCELGFDAGRGTFTQSYGSSALDASTLLIPRVGFLPFSDERVVGTVEAVQKELSRDGLLLRYSDGPGSDAQVLDGLPGDEGVFLACSFWLAEALDGIGRHDEAVALFERLLGLANDVGLLSEEYDVSARRQLGNTPQAFSHVGLVNAARHLSGGSAASAAGC
ncbi:MAG: glycoside hydrolase family 15 protein [Kineosporiaceae bacterium]